MSRGEVFVLTTDPLERPGGVERFLRYFVGGLEERGYAVRIFHRENTAPAGWRQPPPQRKLWWHAAMGMQGYFIGRAAEAELHAGVRLVLSNSTVGWYGLGDGVPQAHFYHGTYRGQARATRPLISARGYFKLTWWDAMVLERLSGREKLCLCNSDQTREEIRRFFGLEGHTVWLPLDTEHFRPLDQEDCRRALGLPGGPIGLFVGGAQAQKGLTVVLRLARSTPEVHWVFALRGPVPEPARTLANVRVVNDAPYEQLPLLYGAADLSVCPSRYEPFGYVVAEALACGIPVVATPGGASRLLLQDTLGELLVASPDDEEGFARGIRLVLADPGHWRARVLAEVRPRVEELLRPETWWRRFLTLTGLPA